FLGNISEVARVSGLDRRSVHRLIVRLKINIAKFREERMPEYVREHVVQGIIEHVLQNYKTSLNEEKLKELLCLNIAFHVSLVSKELMKIKKTRYSRVLFFS
ncbi:MAG: hypothetical protein IH946_05360, partial [Bacteroidetes bacterium]|nr:hypothetical protein [Bacteroidota bacterium]